MFFTPTPSLHMVFAEKEKNDHFPPCRLVSPEDPAYVSAHSPLSPLTPSSPLYPDGLIASIWIRKYTTFIPSVFILFLHMFEMANTPLRSLLDAPDTEHECKL
ncbi:hypothetical protein JVT61DRAFT_9017 [Boletus reticuloceps]|uniref:Uncharacterized protein n=1 Tax=Boletus reticuloceps TaxID=495285 RepID=A0A8I2YIJ6_9AGAM|nr:hypothetical protein JVT61DRAFT_9017 [Boletus reticuloceps]